MKAVKHKHHIVLSDISVREYVHSENVFVINVPDDNDLILDIDIYDNMLAS